MGNREKEAINFITDNIKNSNILSISAIGSYTINRALRSGSDIDLVVVVDDLSKVKLGFGTKDVFYKQPRSVIDAEGERIELNTTISDGTILDITIIDKLNTPNNPLTDYYENHIGWAKNAICLYGTPITELFNIEKVVQDYNHIRDKRLVMVEKKIQMTKDKIKNQKRSDLHIIYELERYIFIREIIRNKVFNRLSIKHPNDSIPGFDSIFIDELKDCGLEINITRLNN